MLERVFSRLVDLEGVMRMLEGRDGQAAPVQLGDEPNEQRRLARPAPTGQTDDAHELPKCETARAQPGRLSITDEPAMRTFAYSAGAGRAPPGPTCGRPLFVLACSSSTQRLWWARAQPRSTWPDPMAS